MCKHYKTFKKRILFRTVCDLQTWPSFLLQPDKLSSTMSLSDKTTCWSLLIFTWKAQKEMYDVSNKLGQSMYREGYRLNFDPAHLCCLCRPCVDSHVWCGQARTGFTVRGLGKVEYAVATVGKRQQTWESCGLLHRPHTINKPGWNIWNCL